VQYGRQAANGAARRETSREGELRVLERVPYPIQQGRHLAEELPPAGQGRIQAPVNPENQLQAPIGLGRTVDGSPPESIQVRRDTAIFRLRLGRSLFERKDQASAREEFLSAIGLDPTLSPPHYYLGRIAEDRGDRELARKWYRSYLARSSGGEHSDEVRERLSGLGN
jgi:tetratricopeptide (TPR) repeat protein